MTTVWMHKGPSGKRQHLRGKKGGVFVCGWASSLSILPVSEEREKLYLFENSLGLKHHSAVHCFLCCGALARFFNVASQKLYSVHTHLCFILWWPHVDHKELHWYSAESTWQTVAFVWGVSLPNPGQLGVVLQAIVMQWFEQINTVKLQIFVRYPFSYFWLETGSYKLIFVLLRASQQNHIEIRGSQNKKKFSYSIKFSTFSKYEKYEIKYRTKICDFTVDQKEAVARYSMVVSQRSCQDNDWKLIVRKNLGLALIG